MENTKLFWTNYADERHCAASRRFDEVKYLIKIISDMKKCWDLHLHRLSVPHSTHVGPSSSRRFSFTSCLFYLCMSGGLESCLQCDCVSCWEVMWLTSIWQHLSYSSCMFAVYNLISLTVHDVICAATSTAAAQFSFKLWHSIWPSSGSDGLQDQVCNVHFHLHLEHSE